MITIPVEFTETVPGEVLCVQVGVILGHLKRQGPTFHFHPNPNVSIGLGALAEIVLEGRRQLTKE